jgi:hypothetical protein
MIYMDSTFATYVMSVSNILASSPTVTIKKFITKDITLKMYHGVFTDINNVYIVGHFVPYYNSTLTIPYTNSVGTLFHLDLSDPSTSSFFQT